MNPSPLRVLHVNAGNLYGGVERILVALAARRALCPEMEPRFALSFNGRLHEELEASRVPVHLVGNVRIRSPLSVWRARRALRERIRGDRPDVVVCHSAWCLAVFGEVARSERVPLVQWLHNRTTGRQPVELLAKRTPPDLVLCVSRSTADTAGNLHPSVRRAVWYAPLTRDPREFENTDRAAVRAELGTAEGDAVLIQVSRMEAWKGQHQHLEALGRLRDLGGWTCWLVGGAERPSEAAYLSSLKEKAGRLGIAHRVRFLGPRVDVPRLLGAADVFCQPNLDTEGFSIAFTEAFLARLPIVTSAIGGALEIVDESCGILLPPGDVHALAKALRRLIVDPNLVSRLGEAGRARVLELCEPRRQLARLRDVFASVVGWDRRDLRLRAGPDPCGDG